MSRNGFEVLVKASKSNFEGMVNSMYDDAMREEREGIPVDTWRALQDSPGEE
ncbi:hypothetical protein QM806_14290 [Rhodococcus sp. IEGM 1351]|uniref:hypothetical protein n=1 Tax=Rhodococcus sp. IEGM 1351 TaxID=3047089 RepID=UPI0024B751C2|nr:hypothetical protein [Rhodococcus sp. IEGM 1351]MDI9936588.1 hypothetical protein [Rhodococcus sp. IEGM 1351]